MKKSLNLMPSIKLACVTLGMLISCNVLHAQTTEDNHLLSVEDEIGEVKVPIATPEYTAMLSSKTWTGNGLMVGLAGTAISPSPSNYRRLVGVRAEAGNGETGYNYGLYSQLSGTRWGTALYSTVYPNDYPAISSRYAGYFHGNVFVTGNLHAESIESPSLYCYLADNSGNASVFSENSAASRLSCVNATCLENTSQVQSLHGNETINDTRLLYALSADDVEEYFPEIMKVNEDGTKMVNYMELIPILVQAINELKAEVDELRGVRSPSRPMMAPANTTTGINHASVNELSSSTYDLQGRRTVNSTPQGVIIRDGQKSFVK